MTELLKKSEASEDPLAIKDRMTLPEILNLMQAADDGLTQLTTEDLQTLAGKLFEKVDAYEYFIEKCEAESARLAMRIKDFQQTKKGIDGKVDNLKKLLVFHMQKHGFKRLPGDDYVAVLSTSQSVKLKVDATPGLYVRHADYMRLSYEWDKNKLKAALKAGDAAAAEVAEFEERCNVNFAVNKGTVE